MQADPEWQGFLKMSAEAGNLLAPGKPHHDARAILPAAALICGIPYGPGSAPATSFLIRARLVFV
jgi:hypothetical protein